ncbi:MAG: hypothetical protein K9N55_07145 [Phycisphaerae bacterium]|nr:hypothetical protein [Phycisphaerae bacterium]
MLDVFTQFEQSAVAYHPLLMVGPGLVGVFLGIFLWLGGSLCARISAGLVWWVLVAGLGIFYMKPLAALGMGLMACMIAMIMKRFSTGLLTSVLAMFLVFLAVCQAKGSPENANGRPVSQSSMKTAMPTAGGTRLGIPETFEDLKGRVSDVYRAGLQVGQVLEIKYLVVVGVSGFFTLLIGCVAGRLAETVSCAAAGVLLMWGGMVLMLLSKGALPLRGLAAHGGTYVAMMCAMIGVGALEQLLFCAKPKDRQKHAKPSSDKKGN